jgi:mannose-6-phosphate isomerase-like protein (cupin superfamily)
VIKEMEIVRGKTFTADRAWGAKQIANMRGITTKIHWTNEPYKWHINDGEEVFVVLDGVVDMHYKEHGVQSVVTMEAGDIFFAAVGTAHVAHPRGEARILVVEQEGSV